MSTDLLTKKPQLGSLKRKSWNNEAIFIESGWYKLDNYDYGIVLQRPLYGRRWFVVCALERVISFTPYLID